MTTAPARVPELVFRADGRMMCDAIAGARVNRGAAGWRSGHYQPGCAKRQDRRHDDWTKPVPCHICGLHAEGQNGCKEPVLSLDGPIRPMEGHLHADSPV